MEVTGGESTNCSCSNITDLNIRTCKDIVEYLIKNKFSRLSYDDKLFIKDLEVPRVVCR